MRLGHLLAAKRSDATVWRLLWLTFWGERAIGYAEAIEIGITEREMVAAVNGGARLSDYIKAREVASHAEILEAQAAAMDVFGYTWLRRWGEAHDEAIRILRNRPPYQTGDAPDQIAADRSLMADKAREAAEPNSNSTIVADIKTMPSYP
ncbi:hypothetical protein OG417_51055 [Actinoallomurus sp. NBC_01490]|uniref:hypothetical protein n=1 Tax=Actinoallomurus sp. NBC_01490 TaxID=2903557 RepID=UPI002E36D1D9|nr:hypothetical protein [Actinoallomurus sp. NBC_01490]